MKIPPFIATLGMMMLLKGLSLVVSADKPIYFTDTDNFYMISQDSLIGYLLAEPADSERGPDPVCPRGRELRSRSIARRSAATPLRSAATRKPCACPA